MGTCFIIQPFDGGGFDKRYRDVIKPAVEAAGLEPYRVDEDPAVSVPIEDIERGIRDAQVLVAEISRNNPNVWFELGFAIACRKEVVLVCSRERPEPFPFDIQHRNIILYDSESSSDFDDLKQKIQDRLEAAIKKGMRLDSISSPIADVEGLSQHEMVALVAIAENLESNSDFVAAHIVRQDIERSGYTRVAAFVALNSLVRKGLARESEDYDFDRNVSSEFFLTASGIEWLMASQDRLTLKTPPITEEELAMKMSLEGKADDDIPF